MDQAVDVIDVLPISQKAGISVTFLHDSSLGTIAPQNTDFDFTVLLSLLPLILLDQLDSLEEFLSARLIFGVLPIEVDEDDIGQGKDALHDRLVYPALAVHEHPAVALLVALVEKDVHLSIRKYIVIVFIESFLGAFPPWNGQHVHDLGLAARENRAGAHAE